MSYPDPRYYDTAEKLKSDLRLALAVILLLLVGGCAAFDTDCADYYNSVCPTVSFGVTLEIPLARSQDLKRKHTRDVEEEPIIEEPEK